MPTERIQYLAKRFFDNVSTPSEMEELAVWVNASNTDDNNLKEVLQAAWQQHSPSIQMPDEMSRRLLTAISTEERTPRIHRVHFLRRFGWWAAAAVLVLVTGTWWLQTKEPVSPASPTANTEIRPGLNGAILTLADGRKIILDSLQDGMVTTQGNTSVKVENGQLVYDAGSTGPIAYNTMTTPKGRQFSLKLPDGSQVWLNAASSISYPTIFSGTQRKVTVTGEAYFEIAANAKQPFYVETTGGMQVQVLGTHFNVNAYNDEGNIKTTLLQGSVRIISHQLPVTANRALVLKPGQQAIYTNDNKRLTVDDDPDMNDVMAWKNGVFYFRNASLPKVMMQLERWYDIDVQYTGQLPEYKISGKMDRGLNLQEVLDFLGKMEVKYKLSGRTVMIQGN